MFTAGTPADNPASDAVLVTSGVVTSARRYLVNVIIAAEAGFWANFVHRAADGSIKNQMFLPVVGSLLGPVTIGDMYFGIGEYAEVRVREGAATVEGTVQASIELR